jgi:hypothetical protein
MKKILLSLAAVGAIAAAATPAAAQSWGGHDGGYRGGYDADRGGQIQTPYLDRLNWKIVRAAREGRISWDDARELRREVREVQPLAWRVQTGQADRWEARRLERRVSRIERVVDNRGWGDRDDRRAYDNDDRNDGWRR